MQEAFLHFIWKLQYFNRKSLNTTCGQNLQIINQGNHNDHAGPDFSFAKVKIGNLLWAGHIEIHWKTSDWSAHNHQKDTAYDNVILHVVWEDNGKAAYTSKGLKPPILTLKELVRPPVLQNYQALLQSEKQVPCTNSLIQVPDIYRNTMLEKAIAERLQRKADEVLTDLKLSKNDWEQTAYLLFMRTMGFKKNAQSFTKLARLIPFKIIKKQEKPFQVEAILFGQAGFLSGVQPTDAYMASLQKEHNYLSAKYNLSKPLLANEWHFMRLRPSNFPTVRLAQAATVLFHYKKLLTWFTDTTQHPNGSLFEKLQQSTYWQQHYHFGKKAAQKISFIGKDSQQILLINVVAPLLVARASYLGDEDMFSKSISLLLALKPEKNSIVKLWQQMGIKTDSAYISQALLEMYHQYCQPKKCLSCSIGTHLLKKDTFATKTFE